jgi:hypothetical protein
MFQKLVYLLAAVMPFGVTVTAQTTIVDATKGFVKSTESTFDHEITLKEGQLAFHWNDIAGNTFEGRLIHTALSVAEAPSWLGVGFFDIENQGTISADTAFMVGSDAVIGLVETGSVEKYSLDGKLVAEKDGVHPMEHQTLVFSSIVQHDADDGTVTTVLSFEKLLEESDSMEVRLLHSGENVFLWAVGPPEQTALGKHTEKGVFTLDLTAVQQEAESGNEGSGSNGTTSGKNTESSDKTKNVASVIEAECDSNVQSGYLMLELLTGLSFHWKVEGTTFTGILQYEGEGWLGFGFSDTGNMIGGTAIIGLPAEKTVGVRDLKDKSIKGISVSTEQNLIESSITQEKGVTQLRFKKEMGTYPVINKGANTFIFAVGEDNVFGYHEHRDSVRVKDLVSCSSINNRDGLGLGMTHMGAFAAHGTIATLAWGIASPFAITVAWFRTLVPSSWIYIHVFSNVLTFFFTLIAVIVAISAMSVQPAGAGGHFSDPHHWVGLVLLVAVTFQVMNGFLRPPVEKKDPYAASHYDMDNSFIKCPRTPREVWYFSHRTTGIAMLAMGIYQIQSGLNLFARDYGVESIVSWYWGYVGLFAFCLISLKFWIMFEEYKARRGMEAMHVDHRSPGGSSAGGLSHADSELVPVQFDMS